MDRAKADLSRSSAIQPLYSNYRKEGERYYKKTGIFPPQHITVVRESILEEYPWVASSLYQAFEEAKSLCMQRLYNQNTAGIYSLVFARRDLEEQRKVSTGKEVIRPSDEPSEAPAIFYLRQSLNAREQHHRNLDHAQGKIDLIDAALGESGDVLREAKTLASSQGGDRF